MFPEPPRHRERRGGMYVLLAVTLLLAVSFGFTSLRSDRADLREFVDLARVAALEQEALAADFRAFLSFELQGADRDRITALFGSIETSAQARIDELAELQVPRSGANAEALFSEALSAWLAGSSALEAGLLAAADEPENPLPIITIDDALMDLRVGDRLYARFLSSIGGLRAELETDVGTVPPVAYAPVGGLGLSGEALAEAVRTAGEVAAFHDVRVGQIGLDPDFTGGEHDGVGVLAFTDTINVTVVISNTGNLPESDLIVAVLVSTVADDETIFSEQTTILSLDPGASQAVEFSDIPVVEGITHEVLAIVSAVAEDIDRSNNTATLPFSVQSES